MIALEANEKKWKTTELGNSQIADAQMEILAGGGFGRKGMVPTIVGMRGEKERRTTGRTGKGSGCGVVHRNSQQSGHKAISSSSSTSPLKSLDIEGHKKHFKRQKCTTLSIMAYPGKNESASKNLIL